MNVESAYDKNSDVDCSTNNLSEHELYGEKAKIKDYEFSSKSYDGTDSIFEDHSNKMQSILENTDDSIQLESNWSSNFGPSNFEISASVPVDEPVAVS